MKNHIQHILLIPSVKYSQNKSRLKQIEMEMSGTLMDILLTFLNSKLISKYKI